MNAGTLTNNAYLIFTLIYKEYTNRIKKGISKSNALEFSIERLLEISNEDEDDIDFALEELKENNFIKLYITGDFELTKDGVNYMENRFSKKVNKIIEKIPNIINTLKKD